MSSTCLGMDDLEANYHDMDSQVVVRRRWFKLAGTAFGAACLVVLWIVATSGSFSPLYEPTNLFSLANSRSTYMRYEQRLPSPHLPGVSRSATLRNADASNVLRTYGISHDLERKLPKTVTRAAERDLDDESTYLVDPKSRLGRLALEYARLREDRERVAASADSSDEPKLKVPNARKGVAPWARNMASVVALTNFFHQLDFLTSATDSV